MCVCMREFVCASACVSVYVRVVGGGVGEEGMCVRARVYVYIFSSFLFFFLFLAGRKSDCAILVYNLFDWMTRVKQYKSVSCRA